MAAVCDNFDRAFSPRNDQAKKIEFCTVQQNKMFEYGIAQLNDLLFDELVDNVAKEALKPSIFVVQKAAAPKNGVKFRQGCNDTIRSSLWEPSLKIRKKLGKIPA